MNDALKDKLSNYSPPKSVSELIKNTKLVFLVGVSGAGKDTILQSLLKSTDFHLIISHTTRKPRVNHGKKEVNGVDYHFIDFNTAGNMLESGGYVEAKQYSGNIYGTSVAEIQMAHDEGKIAIADIEVQGVEEYHTLADTITPIFILPPDFDTWQERLSKRHKEVSMDKEHMRLRLETAVHELKDALAKPYFEFVVNDDLDLAIKVASEIAHGHKSKQKNEEAKTVAEGLLKDLEDHLQKL